MRSTQVTPARHYFASSRQRVCVGPFPVANLWQILAVLIDIEFVLDEFVLDELIEIRAFGSQAGNAIDYILHKVEAVEVVLYSDVKGGGDRSLFLVSADVNVAVGPAIGEAV